MKLSPKFLLFLLLGVVAIVFLDRARPSAKPVRPAEVSPAPAAVADKPILEKRTVLVADVEDVKPANVEKGGATKYFSVSGKLASASLVFVGFVERDALTEKWDDLYIKIGNGRIEDGGHFVGPDSSFESLTIDLARAEFYPAVGRTVQKTYDFLPLLNSGREIRFDIFISSARPNRYIHEATLLYTCDGECEVSVNR